MKILIKSTFAFFIALIVVGCANGIELIKKDQNRLVQSAITQWEHNMVLYGEKWGRELLHSDKKLNKNLRKVYYDAERIYLQIAEYTDDPKWNRYASESENIYRDQYLIPNNYSIPGYWRFPHGLYMDFIKNRDLVSKNAVLNLKERPAISNIESSEYGYQWYWQRYARPIAYAIEANLLAEKIGEPRNELRMSMMIDASLNHINEWVTGDYGNPDDRWNYAQPFFFGLVSEALIAYYERSIELGDPDERIPVALKRGAQWFWDNTWVDNVNNSGYGAFKYIDHDVPEEGTSDPAPALNLLIAPAYMWLYTHTKDKKYLERSDKIFIGGVKLAKVDYSSKIFNQNYRWSFEYVNLRKGIND